MAGKAALQIKNKKINNPSPQKMAMTGLHKRVSADYASLYCINSVFCYDFSQTFHSSGTQNVPRVSHNTTCQSFGKFQSRNRRLGKHLSRQWSCCFAWFWFFSPCRSSNFVPRLPHQHGMTIILIGAAVLQMNSSIHIWSYGLFHSVSPQRPDVTV